MNSDLIIHFLNVGHGDCTVICHPSGRITVIDTSNGEEIDESTVYAKLKGDRQKLLSYHLRKAMGQSGRLALKESGIELELTNPCEFLERHYPGRNIFRYIQTHPDMDHMRGLTALEPKIVNFWDTSNDRVLEPRASDEDDWNTYKRFRSDDRRKVFTRGDRRAYFGCDEDGSGVGDSLQVLSPSPDLVKSCTAIDDWNNLSLIVRVEHAGTSIIFGGDAGDYAWKDVLGALSSNVLKCAILKASHHGRKTGFLDDALKVMAPTIAILSIGDECDHEARAEYERHCKYVWSTYECGDITLRIDVNGGIHYTFAHALVK